MSFLPVGALLQVAVVSVAAGVGVIVLFSVGVRLLARADAVSATRFRAASRVGGVAAYALVGLVLLAGLVLIVGG